MDKIELCLFRTKTTTITIGNVTTEETDFMPCVKEACPAFARMKEKRGSEENEYCTRLVGRP